MSVGFSVGTLVGFEEVVDVEVVEVVVVVIVDSSEVVEINVVEINGMFDVEPVVEVDVVVGSVDLEVVVL